MFTDPTEEEFFDFKCPCCQEMNSFPQNSIGYVRECFNCMESLIVPEADSEYGKEIRIPIFTSRLILRRFEAKDEDHLLEFMFEDEEEAAHWWERNREVKLTTLGAIFTLGVQVQDSGKIIGSVGLHFSNSDYLEAEISGEWNTGDPYEEFAKEAIAAVLEFCFKDLKLHRVFARGNDVKHCHLYEASGMRREGEFVKHHYFNGEWLNTTWFALLDEEYR